jgi:hypothetical protein
MEGGNTKAFKTYGSKNFPNLIYPQPVPGSNFDLLFHPQLLQPSSF